MNFSDYQIDDLTGPLLDYAVFLAETHSGIAVSKPLFINALMPDTQRNWYSPSMKAEHGWPIVERTNSIVLYTSNDKHVAAVRNIQAVGPTLLIAFCRAYAISVLGPILRLPALETP